MFVERHAAVRHGRWPVWSSGWALSLILLLVAGLLAWSWLWIVKTEGRNALATTARLRTSQAQDLTTSLTRTGAAGEGIQVDVVLATPTFFRLTGRPEEAARLGADRQLVFVANENVHYGALSSGFAPILRVDNGSLHVPSDVQVLTDAVHHRTSVLRFDELPAKILDESHSFELLLPATASGERTVLQWATPVDYPESVRSARGLGLGLLLSLAAGLLAAISPCLLQLTAFYLPTLAGVSVAASDAHLAPAQRRRKVMGTAALFILGFTVPYTAGGALMGGMGQVLVGSGLLSPTGPIATGAGVTMILMAFVVAYRARAPLVCRLPVAVAKSRGRRLAAIEPFIAGFAIATGCLACFGGAILGVLLVYAGLLGSAVLGGLAMFLFSMGLAIPFLLAALSFSWVLPVALRVQRATPVIGVLASLLMLFFGVTMATGNFHVVSGWLYQHLPLA
ncbi:MAG: hypothetical protein HY329_24770 [Chloroflexi bacterium]|nr:hypothetical protein [Chloroflexota bacterium]